MRKLKGDMGAITLVLTGVTIIIGIYIFFQIFGSLPASATQQISGATAAQNLSAFAIQNVSVAFANAIQLLTIGMIILAAAVVLSYVFLIRGA